MKEIKFNINNLTSFWQKVGVPLNSFFEREYFDYSFIEISEWPNRLWFNKDIDQKSIDLVKNELPSILGKLTIPYWNIYNNKLYQLLEKNGFELKFEQIGMSLKIKQSYKENNHFKIIKVSNIKETIVWSELFEKSFGYFINPILLQKTLNSIDYYIAYHKKELVGTGILYRTENVSGIHSVGIIPNQRRKGYAELIMKLLINQSVKYKSEYVMLQASNMGLGLYLKLGFKENFRIKNYALQQ